MSIVFESPSLAKDSPVEPSLPTMDAEENLSSAARTALRQARRQARRQLRLDRISTTRNNFQCAYELSIESRRTNQLDPREENLWPYYRKAAYARALDRAERHKRRLPRDRRATLARLLLQRLNGEPSFRMPSRSPEPVFIDIHQLHNDYLPENDDWQETDILSQHQDDSDTESHDSFDSDETISIVSVQEACDEDFIAAPETDDYNEPTVEKEQLSQTDIPDTIHSTEHPVIPDSLVTSNDIPTETEPASSIDPFGAEAYKAFLEANPQYLLFPKTPDQTKQPQSNVLHQPHPENELIQDTSSVDHKAALPLAQQPKSIIPAALLQPSSTPSLSTSKPSTVPSTPLALTPRPSNTHLEPRLLDHPSAAALAKMENTTVTTRTDGGGRGDQEAWSAAERQLLHRAANQWWHWKDNNKLSKAASSGAALYRYFELVFAEAGISRSYYQLKNQWSRNERARYGRSEQRIKSDGTARDLVTSARPAAKARVEAETAKFTRKRSRTDMGIVDGDDEDYQVGGYGSQPKSAKLS